MSKSICQNCQKIHSDHDLEEVKDITERVAPGEEMPSGECPDCGAVCHPVQEKKPKKKPSPKKIIQDLLNVYAYNVDWNKPNELVPSVRDAGLYLGHIKKGK